MFPFALFKDLPEHGAQILLGALGCQALYWITGLVSPKKYYTNLSPAQKANWNMNIVSFVFSIIVCSGVFHLFWIDSIRSDTIFGSALYARRLNGLAVSYFIWDIVVCIVHYKYVGAPFLFHACACFSVYLLSFIPVYQFYVGIALMYEWSTIFLKVHWFCDKVGLTGSLFQKANGLILLLVFFSVRIVFGTYWTVIFWSIVV
jgi:hypothetical protein